MSINNRIKEVRERFCKGSNTEFARKLGRRTNTTSNWISEGYNVGRGVASEISDVFGVDLDWLLTGVGDMMKSTAQPMGIAVKAFSESSVMVDYIPVHASASFVESICDEKECNFGTIPVIPINGEKLDSHYKVFEVSGDSMMPTINDGALILTKEINEAQWAYAEGVVVVVFNEMVVIKRMAENHIYDNNMVVLSSDNEKYGTMKIELSDIRAIYKAKRKISENIF